ncbi:metabotropic glutamate receptor 3-like [Littorina saxatilis]|uniref:metabotropic glutamate receptor 3-like n=1 Tax=Littorina saxatilis TaxID=31220 RepID=UPI0038B6538F
MVWSGTASHQHASPGAVLSVWTLLLVSPQSVHSAFKPTASGGLTVDRTFKNGANSSKVPVLKAYIDGDIILGGLFPVHHTTGESMKLCSGLQSDRGIERLEAMLFTIDEINANKTLLPGIKLGANIFDTCGMSTYALEQSLEFIRGSFTSLDTTEFICDDGSTATARHTGMNVAGVIGGSYSSVSIQVANLLRLFKLPQISYASTSASLSDKSRYDYFVRTVPPDVLQAKALVDIVQAFNWTYVSTVQSEGEYGKSGMDYFKQEARAKNICIAASVEIPEKANNAMYDKAVAEVMTKTDARVVIVFVRTEDAVGLLDAATRRNSSRRFVFVASDAWGNRAAPVQYNQLVAQGAITLELQSAPIRKFEEYFLSLHPRYNVRNPWYQEYWEEVHKCRWSRSSVGEKECTGDERVHRKLDAQESKVQFIYDAVYAIALALHRMQRDLCGPRHRGLCDGLKTIDGERLLKDYLLNISFDAKCNKCDVWT